jgi:primary-amine oxidase
MRTGTGTAAWLHRARLIFFSHRYSRLRNLLIRILITGDAGAGSCANNLALGCDCLGHVKYFSAWLADAEGGPMQCENVICLHEQDGGIGWKHTNHRTGNAAITRMRELVVQSIITVGNYEYVFAWIFRQDASLELETRATGILSTSLIDPGKTSDWGNVVAPGVLAANHQHLFSVRVDPMVDGQKNTIVQEDSVAITPSEEENPFGNAWRLVKTPFLRSGYADAAPFANRCFKIVNESKTNPISGNPVGYKLVPQPSQMLLAAQGSVARSRAKFAEHHIWVTKYRDGDLWAGGKWTNQSRVEIDGVSDYASRDEEVRNEDVVLWHTFGMTHNPTVEQFPVMPAEVQSVKLTPADFFDRNPALDVPQSRQKDNQSKIAIDAMPTGEVQRKVGGGECCEGERAKL